MRLKTFKWKKVTYSLICEKSLYNRNVSTKSVKVPYEQKLVYQNPVKNQNYLNYTSPTKLVKVHTTIRTVGPVKKLNCLNDVLCFFVLVKPIVKRKRFKTALITSFIILLN